MTPEAIRELIQARPFEPFELRLTNGEGHTVRHPENAMLIGRRLVIGYPETERIVTISLSHVNAYETYPVVGRQPGAPDAD